MSSILKVDTIQDQNGNLIISKDSGGSGFLSPYASSSAAITYTVTVASKTTAHPYYGVGSSNGYFINGIESPIIEIKGNDTSKPYHYKFDQSDSSNSGHPLLFYNNVGKTTGFSTGVTTNGTPGQAGAYTMIAVDSQTPNILYYQCSSHANMGNHTFATSPVVNTGVFLTLPTADGSSGQVVTTNGSGVLSFASVAAAAITSTANGANNRVATYSDADSLNGEANLTFDGSTLHVLSTATTNQVKIENTDGGAASAPDLVLFRNSASPADGDDLGRIHFRGKTDTGAENNYAYIYAISNDVSNGSEDGSLFLGGLIEGADRSWLSLKGTEVVVNDSSNDMDFRVESNANTHALFVQGSDGAVHIGTSTNGSAGAGDLVVNGGVFLGGTAAKNKLDDYEEGTWTPGMATSGGSLSSVSYNAYNKGWYTKIGNAVTLSFSLGLSNKGSGGSGAVRLTGFPFASTQTNASVQACVSTFNSGRTEPMNLYGTWGTYQTIRYDNASGGGELNYSEIANNLTVSAQITMLI